MSFPLEEHSVLTSSLAEEGRVEGILIPKKRELTIPSAPFDRSETTMKEVRRANFIA
jgi:hypothetical protein